MKRRSKKATTIYITELDYNRLSGLIERTRERNGSDREYLNKLEAELDRAEIVEPKEIPADVITMRSKVRLKDLVSGESNTYSLVFPTEADFCRRKDLCSGAYWYCDTWFQEGRHHRVAGTIRLAQAQN